MFGRRIIGGGAFVEKFGAILQADEAMRKARRHPEHLLVRGGQFQPDPFAEMRAGLADIHRHVPHPASDHADQLALRIGVLEMQPAQHAARRLAMIVLHEVEVQPGRLEGVRIPAFVKEAAIVAEHARFDDQRAGNGGFHDVHAIAPLPLRRSIR